MTLLLFAVGLVTLAIIVLVLLFRPQGLFGKQSAERS